MMQLSRYWVMPSKWSFEMLPVKKLFEKYEVGPGWIDPFSGKYSSAEITNDIEDRGANFNMDALEFLKSRSSNSVKGVLFDPPYSVEQCLRKYTPKQGGTAGRSEYWARCKNEISRILISEGICISFCWDSTGMGGKRGFHIIEIILLCHGACHNDTIITVDKKLIDNGNSKKVISCGFEEFEV